MDKDDFSGLDFGFPFIYFQKFFFPKFELLNSGSGLSAGFYGTYFMYLCLRVVQINYFFFVLVVKVTAIE